MNPLFLMHLSITRYLDKMSCHWHAMMFDREERMSEEKIEQINLPVAEINLLVLQLTLIKVNNNKI